MVFSQVYNDWQIKTSGRLEGSTDTTKEGRTIMPNQRRYAIKQSIGFAEQNIRKGQEQLIAVSVPFETVHPEIFQQFCVIVQALEMMLETTKRLRESI